MMHHFDTKLAQEYGLHEAIILNNLSFWTEKLIANDKKGKDNLYWIYNSVSAWHTLFPYLTPKKIRGALDNLIGSGVIVKAKLSENKTNHTNYYALTAMGLAACQNVPIDLPKSNNQIGTKGQVRLVQKGETYNITDNNQQIINTYNNLPMRSSAAVSENKEEFLQCNADVTKSNKEIKSTNLDFDFSGFSELEKESINNWLQHKKESGKAYKTKRGLEALKKQLITFKQNASLIATIDNSMANNYQGLYEPKQNNVSANMSQNNRIKQSLKNCASTKFDRNEEF